VGPNASQEALKAFISKFQSSVRINVGPNPGDEAQGSAKDAFQSSVRINVGPNFDKARLGRGVQVVSILRED